MSILRLHSGMLKILNLSFFTLLALTLYGDVLDVRLPTQTLVKPIYISRIYTDPSEWDWRYFEELRAVLECDINQGGYASVASIRQELEETLQEAQIKMPFPIEAWKKEPFPYVVFIQVDQKQLFLSVIDIQKQGCKKYPSVSLCGKLDIDRRAMHRLSDALHKDLFHVEGIASLRLLYTERTKNPSSSGLGWISEVWICDADGANARQLTFENGYCLSPGFLPKSEGEPEFFYVFNDEGQSKIYRASLSRPQGEILISLRGNQMLPAISNQGNQMAFITDVAGRPDLFLQKLDSRKKMVGKARQIYSSPRATQASPTFSPDGSKIAFVSDKDGPPRIYLLDLVNGNQTQRSKPKLLTAKNRENTSPAWSPDGKKLAYSAKVDGVRQIWIYDFETQTEAQLTYGPETKENPAWAPDSLHLVYNTEDESKSELYLIQLKNPVPVLISKGLGQKRFPAWEIRSK